MKKLVTILTGLFFASTVVFGLQAKNDQDVIDRLSSFRYSGADFSWDNVPQDTKYASNIKKKYCIKIKTSF